MKIGLGLYGHMLTDENLRFAKQAGATHIVAHVVDYFSSGPRIPASVSAGSGWGPTHRAGEPWTLDEIERIRDRVTAAGLELHAIENFDPAHWHDILLDGPRRDEQLEQILESIRIVGAAGIPCLGYNFSLAGVWGHTAGPFGRGGAESIGFDAAALDSQPEIPLGQVWNMTYDESAEPGTIGPVEADEMWTRLEGFLARAVPVAEAAGVRLCAHPDDPPVPRLRNAARIVVNQKAMQRLIDTVPSRSNALDFCQGTVSEMPDVDIYDAISSFSRQDAIGYVHFRNVVGRAPKYHEVFLDEGYVDMIKALRTYAANGFDGVLVPDHTPQMSSAAPWHSGMAFALGFMTAALQAIEDPSVRADDRDPAESPRPNPLREGAFE